jgi:carbonic anhydrase/acetyltransferase-like protein (isoleucine patch superfamily)
MIEKYKNFFPQIDGTCFIAPGSAIIGDVIIGKYSSVWHNTVVRGDVDRIIIGKCSNIQDNSTLHCTHGLELVIGDYVTIGHGVVLHSCVIGDNSLIGMGAILLDGAKVGKNCLVGAGTIVTQNTVIPDGSLVIGSPGRVRRQLTKEEIEGNRVNAQSYLEKSAEYRRLKNNE